MHEAQEGAWQQRARGRDDQAAIERIAGHRCVGVGKCRADGTATGGVMCPSFLATRDEKDSTRGRARVLQELAVKKHEVVLEIGAGSGYMAALLAARGRSVLTIEIEAELAKLAEANLAVLRAYLAEIAQAKRLPVIDMNAALSGHPEMFPDSIHPNAAGAAIMVGTVAKALRD